MKSSFKVLTATILVSLFAGQAMAAMGVVNKTRHLIEMRRQGVLDIFEYQVRIDKKLTLDAGLFYLFEKRPLELLNKIAESASVIFGNARNVEFGTDESCDNEAATDVVSATVTDPQGSYVICFRTFSDFHNGEIYISSNPRTQD